MTGNVERFVKKLNMEHIKIHKDLIIIESFVLVTYTTKMGQIPKKTIEFLEDNYSYLKGVSSSGNMLWAKLYAKAADTISEMYKVPLISKFELSGNEKDVEKFTLEVKLLGKCT